MIDINIIEYAEKEMQRFTEKEFSPIDSLVLSQFSYMFLDEIVPGIDRFKRAVCLRDIFLAEYLDKMLDDVRAPEENKKLLIALAASPRFRDIRVNYYVNEIDNNIEKQFSAVSFILDKHTAYVAFRGTDATFVGWKEDFNMAFLSKVPAQIRAAEYINTIARKLPQNIIVGGHSKGGNLAVYASAMCKESIQKRIVSIYSHDGPGFNEMLESSQFKAIIDRVHKTVPESAIIGMLLENQEDYTVVKSTNTGIMQHDPFSWEIEGDEFSQLEDVTGSAKFMNKTLHNWLLNQSYEDRQRFVEALFQIINASNAKTALDIQKIKVKDIKKIIELTANLDTETKRFLFDAVKSLVVLSIKNIRKQNA